MCQNGRFAPAFAAVIGVTDEFGQNSLVRIMSGNGDTSIVEITELVRDDALDGEREGRFPGFAVIL